MNRSAWLKNLLTIGGVLETLIGVGLLLSPEVLTQFLLRASLPGPVVAIAYLGGGALVAVGIACWCARTTPLAPASIGVAWGFLIYNIVACIALLVAGPSVADGGVFALAAAIFHGALAAALIAALLARQPATSRV